MELKPQDLLIGVKADQSLRDALREDQGREDVEHLELAPVGRKTWIAGRRVGPVEDLAGMERTAGEVHRLLMALGSAQRIRRESVRVWVAAPPVPVFRDPEPRAEETTPGPACPACGREVLEYDLHRDAAGLAVGCRTCGGDPGGSGY